MLYTIRTCVVTGIGNVTCPSGRGENNSETGLLSVTVVVVVDADDVGAVDTADDDDEGLS